MDAFNRWLNQLADNPIAQVIAFLIMFVLRVEADRWQRRRAERKGRKAKPKGIAPS